MARPRVCSSTLPPALQELLKPWEGADIHVKPTRTERRHARTFAIIAMRAPDPETGRRMTTRAIAELVGISERRVVKILAVHRAREKVDG